jgi:cytochrome c oxidase subunit 1
VFSEDHKVIARQFLWAGLIFLLLGGLLAMLIRWQWAYPGEKVPLVGAILLPGSGGVIGPATYQTLFTSHGLIMIFFAITPVLIGAFGNFLIPLQIGAPTFLEAEHALLLTALPAAGAGLVPGALGRGRRLDHHLAPSTNVPPGTADAIVGTRDRRGHHRGSIN